MAERLENYRCPAECPERSTSCHGSCERYAKYREILAKIYKVRQEDREYLAHVNRARDNFRRESGYDK